MIKSGPNYPVSNFVEAILRLASCLENNADRIYLKDSALHLHLEPSESCPCIVWGTRGTAKIEEFVKATRIIFGKIEIIIHLSKDADWFTGEIVDKDEWHNCTVVPKVDGVTWLFPEKRGGDHETIQ